MNTHKSASTSYRLIPGIGLGDSLLFLPAAWALLKKGHKVTIHSHWLKPFENRLSPMKIETTVHFGFSKEDINLSHEEICLIQNHSPAAVFLKDEPNIRVIGHSRFEKRTQGMEIFYSAIGSCTDIEKTLLSLRKTLFETPIKQKKRTLAIHPTSTDELKNWPIKKYLSLAKHLKKEGWHVEVYGSSKENEELKVFKDIGEVYVGLPLPALLQKIAECTLFIGNDSGLGHLASIANIPTISVFSSPSHSKLWRPTWSKGLVVTPFIPLPGIIKKYFWKSQLYVWQILRAVDKLLSFPSPH